VSYAGATTKFGIEPQTGRILTAVYRGRAPSKVGEVRRTYSDFKEMQGGLILPQRWDAAYDGNAPSSKPDSLSVAINVPIQLWMFPDGK
jgi:hypothetical protein